MSNEQEMMPSTAPQDAAQENLPPPPDRQFRYPAFNNRYQRFQRKPRQPTPEELKWYEDENYETCPCIPKNIKNGCAECWNCGWIFKVFKCIKPNNVPNFGKK